MEGRVGGGRDRGWGVYAVIYFGFMVMLPDLLPIVILWHCDFSTKELGPKTKVETRSYGVMIKHFLDMIGAASDDNCEWSLIKTMT